MINKPVIKPRLLKTSKRALQFSLLSVAAFALTIAVPLQAMAASVTGGARDGQFGKAASEFDVPRELLLAVSYNQTRWESHKAEPSNAGGYGLMHLLGEQQLIDGRGKQDAPATRIRSASVQTLDEGARLIGASEDSVKKDDMQNIRAGAALLAKYARDTNSGSLPQSLDGWYAAVSKIQGSTDEAAGAEFADDVYATLRDGVSSTTSDGQTLGIPKQPVTERSVESTVQADDGTGRQKDRGYGEKAECPPTVSCRFIPARFAQNNPDDAKDYGNYDTATRPETMKITHIVLHDTEGSYNSSIAWFQDPASYVSANYVIRSKDGAITQMVKNKDVAWHAGNWYTNMHSIGIEHEGYAAEGGSWYTEAMYRSSAKLVRYLANKYDIPLDREHIIGHEELSAVTPEKQAGMHNDPGPYWDWQHYMRLVGAEKPAKNKQGSIVTIAPRFKDNQPEVTDCSDGTCKQLARQSANFIYLRAEPKATADLVTDRAIHADGKPGTTDVMDTSAKALYGQRYAVADKKGDWTAIWFGGQKGWFYNPAGSKQVAIPSKGTTVRAKDGVRQVAVYGRPLPENAAYKNGVPKQPLVALQYKLSAGESYYALSKQATNDYFHVQTFNYGTPGEKEVVTGNDRYIPIAYGHRIVYVKAIDVQVSTD